jgi:rhodanese-related sulfurtransferase
VIVDVREPWEYAEGHVPGAILIPLGQLAARVDELPGEEPIYVICRSGNRSVTASTLLIEAGKRDVRNVAGGMLAWQAAGYAVNR